jgi:5'-nucleotidase
VVAVGADGDSPEATGTPSGPPAGTPQAPAAVPAGAISVGSATAPVGGKVTISGNGFKPGTTVVLTLYSTPVDLGSVTVAADGTFTATVTLPSSVTAGSHTLLATGLASDGTVRYVVEAVTVTAPGAAGGLPVTGVDVNRVVLIAFALLMAGMVLVAGADGRLARRLARRTS